MITGGRNKRDVLWRFPAWLVEVILLIGLSGALVAPVSARTITPEQQLGLADHFFARGEYAQAVIEYETFCYLFAENARTDYARFRIGLAFFQQSRYEQALEKFQGLATAGSLAAEPQATAGFMVSRCYAAMGRRVPAVANLKQMLESAGDKDLQERIFYQLGWIYLESSPELAAADLDRAAEYFSLIRAGEEDPFRAEMLEERLAPGQAGREEFLSARKSPALAGGLAVFPGGGYLYCGRYRDALVSLLFNGGMIWAAAEAYDNDLEVLGTMIALVDFGFYAGSIYGSVSAAHKHNRRLSADFIENLTTCCRVAILPVHGGRGIMAGVTVPF